MQQLALAVAVLAFLGGALYLIRTAMRRAPGPVVVDKVPAALRPGDTDDVLESDRLNSITRWGFVTVLAMAAFLPIYWFQEASERRGTEELFNDRSIDRGRYYFAMREDPVTGDPPPTGIGHPAGEPIECARCHGSNLEGGTNEFIDPNTGVRRTVQVPELRSVFARYQKPPPGYDEAREYIKTVIERGRTDGILGVGVDMPTWGSEYGGPLVDQQIEDLINYIESVQGVEVAEGASGEQIFGQFCSPCHGPAGSGGTAPAMTGGAEQRQFPNIEDHIAFVKSGSSAGQPYGTSGTGTGAMPPHEGTLTDEQIRAVVEYERTL
jgi:mono/diheme cytochrome c family protein